MRSGSVATAASTRSSRPLSRTTCRCRNNSPADQAGTPFLFADHAGVIGAGRGPGRPIPISDGATGPEHHGERTHSSCRFSPCSRSDGDTGGSGTPADRGRAVYLAGLLVLPAGGRLTARTG